MNLRGWKITSVPIDKQVYNFPDISLKPGESMYVHSGRSAGVKKLDGINLVWTKAYIWNNKGDTCKLINSSGETVDEFSYK